MDRKDYADALSKAQAILEMRPNDPAASKLKTEAQAQSDLANNLKAQAQEYTAAMNLGRAAWDRKDYQAATTQAAIALAIKSNDPAAMKLKNDAQAQLVAARKAQQDAEAAK